MSEREEIMDLIRNEYDPAPNHYRMGDDWDDGAGRIADAILADKMLLLRKLETMTRDRDKEYEMKEAAESRLADWQPIKTAPKDGTHILAYRLPIGIRVTNMTNPPTVVHWFDDGFYTSVNELAPEHPFNPTHWMPLPSPPVASHDGGQE